MGLFDIFRKGNKKDNRKNSANPSQNRKPVSMQNARPMASKASAKRGSSWELLPRQQEKLERPYFEPEIDMLQSNLITRSIEEQQSEEAADNLQGQQEQFYNNIYDDIDEDGQIWTWEEIQEALGQEAVGQENVGQAVIAKEAEVQAENAQKVFQKKVAETKVEKQETAKQEPTKSEAEGRSTVNRDYEAEKAAMEREVLRFRMELLKKMPFYGDIVMKLPFEASDEVETAATNGKRILYNVKFFRYLDSSQRNYVLMHEVLHVLLMHWERGKQKDPSIWNAACDYVVNRMVDNMVNSFKNKGIQLRRPPQGLFYNGWRHDLLVEDLYAQILADNKSKMSKSQNGNGSGASGNSSQNTSKKLTVCDNYENPNAPHKSVVYNSDLLSNPENGGLSEEEARAVEQTIKEWIRSSASRNRGTFGSYEVPGIILQLVETKRLPWRKLLYEYLEDALSDESSYLTPERKYLHMDLIIPGCESNAAELGEIWAFVDSSGSIGDSDLNQFLTQLCRISKEFQCVVNLAYWDTRVTDVYTKLRNPKQILGSKPKHTGGTDIQCVYDYINNNKLKPGVLLILTDGYFGNAKEADLKKYAKKTIMVLSVNRHGLDGFKIYGKLATL